jgi:pimeloyl-ACP methyl ester carboxylesterase
MTAGVVFVHGMWSQRSVWDTWLPAFVERGYVCEVVALPGHHGKGDDADLARVGFAECVGAVASAASRFDRPILIGHSMGGLIVQQLATRLPLRAAVLINSAAPRAVFPLRLTMLPGLARHFLRWGLWNGVLRLSRREADYLLYSGLAVSERERLFASTLGESGRIAYQLGFGRLGLSRVHEVDPERIGCPMLLLAGRRDHMIPVGVSRAVARYYGAKLAYREFADNAHWLLGEAGYRERISEVLAWLAEQARS